MVSEFFLNVFFSIVTGILSLFPHGIEWNVDSGIMGTFLSVVSSICYFLPMGTVRAIIALIVSFGVFRVAIRLIKTLWDLLPVV